MGKEKKVKVLVAQLCPTLSDPTDCNPPGSSVCGIYRARVLEWVAILFSRASSQPRDRTWVSWIADRFFTVWPLVKMMGKKADNLWSKSKFLRRGLWCTRSVSLEGKRSSGQENFMRRKWPILWKTSPLELSTEIYLYSFISETCSNVLEPVMLKRPWAGEKNNSFPFIQ